MSGKIHIIHRCGETSQSRAYVNIIATCNCLVLDIKLYRDAATLTGWTVDAMRWVNGWQSILCNTPFAVEEGKTDEDVLTEIFQVVTQIIDGE